MVFSSGSGPDGKPRVRATVCPIRLLDPEAEAIVAWFMECLRIDAWTGRAEFVAEWPRKGGILRQDARLVDAVNILRAELEFLPKPKAAPAAEPAEKRKR